MGAWGLDEESIPWSQALSACIPALPSARVRVAVLPAWLYIPRLFHPTLAVELAEKLQPIVSD